MKKFDFNVSISKHSIRKEDIVVPEGWRIPNRAELFTILDSDEGDALRKAVEGKYFFVKGKDPNIGEHLFSCKLNPEFGVDAIFKSIFGAWALLTIKDV